MDDTRSPRPTILEALRADGALSRKQIAAATGLSLATVSRKTSELLASGIVVPFGHTPSTGGRPPALLRYAGGSRVFAAVQVGARELQGALIDLDDRVTVRRTIEPVQSAIDGENGWMRQVRDLIESLAKTASTAGTPCLAAGVAVPGVVAGPGDTITAMIGIEARGFALGRYLRESLDLPVVVENDANCLACGEVPRGGRRRTMSMVGLLVGNGVGAGIVTGGELHKGAHGEAGEIGYLLVERSSLRQSVTDRGDLEDHIGQDALTRRARSLGLVVPDDQQLTATDVFRLAAEGKEVARDLADEILDMVTMAVAAMVIVLDPDLVVIGSADAAGDREMVSQVRDRLQGRIIHVPQLAEPRHGADAVLVGVARLAARRVVSH